MDADTTAIQKGKQAMVEEEDHTCGQFSKLPTDIIFDILSRLPIKLLSPCRWVCKTWFHLIHHPSLAKLHHTRSLQTNTSPCYLFYDEWKDFFMVDHQVFDHFKTTAPLYNVKLTTNLYPIFRIVGSVNGLICLSPNHISYSHLHYYICNPVTGEDVKLPAPSNTHVSPALSGFGFDSVSNEYKVVRILHDHQGMKCWGEVFTLGLDSWRVMQGIPYISDTTQTNVLVNGSLHWLTQGVDLNSLSIVSWVVATEEFHVIQLHADINSHGEIFDRETYLGVLEGCLCFIIADSVSLNPSSRNEIWVMKDYGVQTSWVKEYTVKRIYMASTLDGGCALTKLKNDEFLFHYKRKALGYYDSKSEIFKLIVIDNKLCSGSYVQTLMHLGSLFSPSNVAQLTKRNIKQTRKIHEKSIDSPDV